MKAILACEKNGGIGFEGSMPWPKQDKDLQRFKDLTLGSTVLMGRGTWESTGMPKPLPDRKNIVMTTSQIPLPENVGFISSTDSNLLNEVDWVIGGANLIDSVWDQITEFHLTHLLHEYECDTHIDLERLQNDFIRERSVLNLTHKYEIWRRKDGNNST